MYQKTQLAVGVASLLIGIVTLAYNAGAFNYITLSTLAVAPEGKTIGVDVSTSVVSYPLPLATVAPGKTYQWEATAKNTGDIEWDDSWITVRIGVSGASTTTRTESGVTGSFAVEKCSAGIDTSACREDLREWNLKYKMGKCSQSGTWQTPTIEDKVASLVLGSLSPGSSKTVCFKVTVPSDASGSYPLITNLMAWVGGTYAVDHKTDTISIGEISGSLTLNFIGILTLSLGAIFTALAFKKP